jgi:hypothetical protein
MNDQANELNGRDCDDANRKPLQKVRSSSVGVECIPDVPGRIKTGGKQRDGDGQILRLAAHGKEERESNDAHKQVQPEAHEVDHRMVECHIAGVARRLLAMGNEDAISGERRIGAKGAIHVSFVDGKANGDHQVATRSDHTVWNVIRGQVELAGLQHPNHLAVSSDAHAVDVEFVAAVDVLDLDRQVTPFGIYMNVNAIPGVRNIVDTVVGQLLVCGDNLPAAVVEGGRGVGGVVVRGKEPVGAKLHPHSQPVGIEVAGVQLLGCGSVPSILRTGERCAANGEKQNGDCLEDAGKHPDNYSAKTMLSAGKDRRL